MTTILIILCILGALVCFGRCAWLLLQPPEHDVEGCIQKPRGWRN